MNYVIHILLSLVGTNQIHDFAAMTFCMKLDVIYKKHTSVKSVTFCEFQPV